MIKLDLTLKSANEAIIAKLSLKTTQKLENVLDLYCKVLGKRSPLLLLNNQAHSPLTCQAGTCKTYDS